MVLEGERSLEVDLGYEVGELIKDILFFEKGEDEFYTYLERLHPGFSEEVERGVQFLEGKAFRNFVTDRDGTVNNYCGRYRSSIQSCYNAVFLSRFIQKCTEHSVVITSAPLKDPGVVTVSVMPPKTFIYAASKAREFIDEEGQRRTFPVDAQAQSLLDELNGRLSALVKKPGREKFTLIGSGLQFKFGETTLARQDISGAVTEEESLAFFEEVKGEVQAVDPNMESFYVGDTGLDIEIVLKKGGEDDSEAEGQKEFDKGDGLLFLDKELGLKLEQGPTLVCGDTGSDLKLVEAGVGKNEDTWTVFVTRDAALIEKVRAVGKETHIVPEPDVLVCMLDRLSRKGETHE